MKKNETVLTKDLEQLLSIFKERNTQKKVYFKEDVNFVLENDQLCVKAGNNVFPVRETALPSILQRMEMGGKVFANMSDQELYEVFKVTSKYMPRIMAVMTSNGIINSINSSQYAHIPMEDILDETLKSFEGFFNGGIKLSASVGYDTTFITFYADKSYTFNKKPRKLCLTLTNSESGMAAVRYGAYLGNSNRGSIPIMSDISVTHKGDQNCRYGQVVESISMIDAVLNNSIKALRYLQRIEVNHVAKIIEAVGKRVGLPQKYIKMVKEQFTNIKTCFASDIYEAYAVAVTDQDNINTLERYKNDVIKMINLDWDTLK